MLLCLFFLCFSSCPSCPLTLKMSPTYQHLKTSVLLLQLIRYTFFVIGYVPDRDKREQTYPPMPEIQTKTKTRKISVVCTLSLLPVAFLSDAPTTKAIPGLPARALVLRRDGDILHRACWFFACRRAGGRRTIGRREESIHTHTQQRQQTSLCAALQV